VAQFNGCFTNNFNIPYDRVLEQRALKKRGLIDAR
jgi:hypothetical protein